MITFEMICVGAVITVVIAVISALLGNLITDEEFTVGAWSLTTFGFGICLTILLYQNGVI